MNKLDYRKTVRSDGFTQIVRRDPETHKYQRWTSDRPEWFTHVDDPGVFIGFTDFIWHDILEEEAFETIAQFIRQQ